jgi:hypothetical protein
LTKEKPMSSAVPTIDASRLRAGKATGLVSRLTFALVVYVTFDIHDRPISDSAAETARNILAHEHRFRLAILKPVSCGLALLVALGRLVWARMWLSVSLRLLAARQLIGDADYLPAFEAERWQILAKSGAGRRNPPALLTN